MNLKTQLNRAILLAAKEHAGQHDRAGLPYILHCLHVMMSQTSMMRRIIAVLHDIMEDTAITFNNLVDMGYDPHIVECVNCLSRRKGESVEDYHNRILHGHDDVLEVKLADVEHNLSILRLEYLEAKDLERLNSYLAFRRWIHVEIQRRARLGRNLT